MEMSTMKAFVSLTPQQALEVAISIEERNAGIYHRFAEMFTEFGDPGSLEIASVFWEMAVEERGHHALLQQNYTALYGVPTASVTEEELVEWIEVPKLNYDELFDIGNDGAARRGALQVALQAEVSAQVFYANLVEVTPDGPLRQIYVELAQMEDGHVASLQDKIAQAVERSTVQ
jgi:rubrerythrin